MSNPKNYTVGWICAITTEYVAAQAFLDDRHEGPEYVSPHDNNDYTLGQIGKHNVVIAVLPDGEYGTASAASVARDMLHSFPNIRIGLMVGIGGGAPTQKHDIRLGDIVVSASRGDKGGVFQYDFGKAIQDQTFQTTGFLNQPPTVLRTAMSGLKAHYESEGHEYEATITDILQKKKRLQKKYKRPEPSNDQLYRSEITHPPDSEASCAAACGKDPSKLIVRPDRSEDENNPEIHYGLIASANQLMKDALVRDKLASEKDVLCFEMEAAGLMNHFPCLVIRGICDYADTHKNKEWQGYAAMTAAAYAKDLLRRILPNKVEAEKRIGEIVSSILPAVIRTQANVEMITHKLDLDEDSKILDWLAPNIYGPQQTDNLRKRQHRTGQWFLNSPEFFTWLGMNRPSKQRKFSGTSQEDIRCSIDEEEDENEEEQDEDSEPEDHAHERSRNSQDLSASQGKSKMTSTPEEISELTLFCPGIPGAGKTILTSIVIEELETRFIDSNSIGVAYLYCDFSRKDQQRADILLASLLRQLAACQPTLPRSVKDLYDQYRYRQSGPLVEISKSLKQLVLTAYSRVFIMIDALDECQATDRDTLLAELFSIQVECGLNIFATSRFIPEVIQQFRGSIQLEIRATVGDVRKYVEGHVSHLPAFVQRSAELQEEIGIMISKAVEGMFLLAKLHLNSLEGARSLKMVRAILETLPTGSKAYDQAYTDAMNRIEGQVTNRKNLANDVLLWIICAKKRLTTLELRHALAIEVGSTKLDEDNLSDVEDLVSACAGLVIFDKESGNVRLVHYTTQEYFERNWKTWFPNADVNIARTCITYLSFEIFGSGSCLEDEDFEERLLSNPLYDYAAQNWGHHARNHEIEMKDTILDMLEDKAKIAACSQAAMVNGFPFGIQLVPQEISQLHLATYFGLSGIAMALLMQGQSPCPRDTWSRTPLLLAVENKYDAIVKLLLDTGEIDVNERYSSEKTLLMIACENGYEAIVKLLLNAGHVDVNADCDHDQTALLLAVENGHDTIVRLLLDTGEVDINADDDYGWTPLMRAVKRGDEAVVQLLLDTGKVDINAGDISGHTALKSAIFNGNETIIKLLINTGKLNINKKDDHDKVALWYSIDKGDTPIIKILLDNGADVNADVNSARYDKWTLLFCAVERRDETIVTLLLDYGADIDAEVDWARETSLSWAIRQADGERAWSGSSFEWPSMVKLLLDKGADINTTECHHRKYEIDETWNWTPLLSAAENGNKGIISLLLERGAAEPDFDAVEWYHYWDSGSWADRNGHKAVVELVRKCMDDSTHGALFGRIVELDTDLDTE